MTDNHTKTLDHYQGLVDELADEDAALEKYRSEFAEKLMDEYIEENHTLSWRLPNGLVRKALSLKATCSLR